MLSSSVPQKIKHYQFSTLIISNHCNPIILFVDSLWITSYLVEFIVLEVLTVSVSIMASEGTGST